MKLKTKVVKRVSINIIVDTASTLLITAAAFASALGFLTLYASYYKTLGLPTPESFSTASSQFASAIGLIFAMLATRKYRMKEDQLPDPPDPPPP